MENDVDMNMANGSRAFPLHWEWKWLGIVGVGGKGCPVGGWVRLAELGTTGALEILLLISFHYAFAISTMNNWKCALHTLRPEIAITIEQFDVDVAVFAIAVTVTVTVDVFG